MTVTVTVTVTMTVTVTVHSNLHQQQSMKTLADHVYTAFVIIIYFLSFYIVVSNIYHLFHVFFIISRHIFAMFLSCFFIFHIRLTVAMTVTVTGKATVTVTMTMRVTVIMKMTVTVTVTMRVTMTVTVTMTMTVTVTVTVHSNWHCNLQQQQSMNGGQTSCRPGVRWTDHLSTQVLTMCRPRLAGRNLLPTRPGLHGVRTLSSPGLHTSSHGLHIICPHYSKISFFSFQKFFFDSFGS